MVKTLCLLVVMLLGSTAVGDIIVFNNQEIIQGPFGVVLPAGSSPNLAPDQTEGLTIVQGFGSGSRIAQNSFTGFLGSNLSIERTVLQGESVRGFALYSFDGFSAGLPNQVSEIKVDVDISLFDPDTELLVVVKDIWNTDGLTSATGLSPDPIRLWDGSLTVTELNGVYSFRILSNSANVLDQSQIGFAAVGPVTAVPEPSPLALVGTVFALAAGYKLRSRRDEKRFVA